MDALDLLMAQSLQVRWKNAGPSPRVWRRIVRRIASLSPPPRQTRSIVPDYPDRQSAPLFTVPLPSAGHLLLWRYDFLLLRIA